MGDSRVTKAFQNSERYIISEDATRYISGTGIIINCKYIIVNAHDETEK